MVVLVAMIWAHPRSRGENHLSASAFTSAKGSSPLTRGKHHRRPDWRARPRLIPAHAGKTALGRQRRLPGPAHPRSRGENTADDALTAQPAGSSPLTRGKRVGVTLDAWRRGLIPAHAGKTSLSSAISVLLRAHPRSRGENGRRRCQVRRPDGSSPLTRGKQGRPLDTRESIGLIPAHAGKTYERKTGQPITAAHPRSRGENTGL